MPRLVAVLAAAEDEDDSVRRLREAYDFTPVQARAVLDAQLRRFNRAHRAELDTELQILREALAAPWDPALDIRAAVHPPELVVVVIDGVEHRIHGEDLDDCLTRLVSLVREKLALPRRRRVTVTTGLTDGPTRILVDPVATAHFFYDQTTAER
jgi:hypothetical protein